MNFKGYLLKFVKTNVIFPSELILVSSWNSTPLQRTELQAYRDGNLLLHRITSPNHKTKLTFDTVPMQLAEYRMLRDLIDSAMENKQQRKLVLEYWDDELLEYRTATFYSPDITYKIKRITENNIMYDSSNFTFIEY